MSRRLTPGAACAGREPVAVNGLDRLLLSRSCPFQHGLTNVFPVRVFTHFFTLVMRLAASGQAYSDFDAAVSEVDIERNQSAAPLFGPFSKFVQFAFVQQQFS